MAINKVVYGATVLVDLTSDTVDAAHLAKGYTAHDAGGDLIVGALEQKTDSNFLSGVTPKLLNGTTKSGKAYTIPEGSEYGKEYIEYQLDIPKLTSAAVYCILVYGHTQAGYRSIRVELHLDDGRAFNSSGSFLFGTTADIKSGRFNLPSGAKPTKLVISHNNQSSSLVISKVMLMALDA